MLYRLALIGFLVGGIGGAAGAVEPKQGQAPSGSEKAIDPKADALLHKMSDYLSSMKTFSVETSTVDEAHVGKDGKKIQQLAESKMVVRRPGEIRLEHLGPNGLVVLRDDGKQFSAFNSTKNIYATAPAPAQLEQAADYVRMQLQVDAPGVDLIASNPYAPLTDGMTEARYLGLVPMGNGVMAHHLAVTKDKVSYQIWIQDGPQPLPLRYVVTGQDMPGAPQFTVVMRNWQANVPIANDTFSFTPPAGATKVAFAPPRKG
jgi:hypothetical protein